MTENKPPRKATPKENETEVLTKSRRRCLLCYYLDGDLSEQKGQIAHLDQDPSNYAIDNLGWACLEHHSEFDSKTSQHKNYTIHEAKFARDELHKAIAEGKHLTYKKGDPKPQPGRAADTKTLDALTARMASTGTMTWLREANFDGWSYDSNNLAGLEAVYHQKGPETEFIDAELEGLRKTFHAAVTRFLTLLATETFVVGGSRREIPEEWETDQPERYRRVVKEAHEGADLVCSTYDELVRAAKRKLSA